MNNPDLRHNVTHVLATSEDLINWKHHGTVLTPSDNKNFDDYTIWTVSIIKIKVSGITFILEEMKEKWNKELVTQ